MYRRILVAVEDYEQVGSLTDLVQGVAAQDVTEVRALHLRLRELSGLVWYARESNEEASLVAEAAVFDLRMAGVGAGSEVRHAFVDKAAEAIVDEATRWQADLIILGSPRRGELAARVFGSVTQRVLQRSPCPVLVAPRHLAGSGRRRSEPSRAGRRH
jgi:nucleotide-binding universal stress UspA family protein